MLEEHSYREVFRLENEFFASPRWILEVLPVLCVAAAAKDDLWINSGGYAILA